jgi:hypothetical protein
MMSSHELGMGGSYTSISLETVEKHKIPSVMTGGKTAEVSAKHSCYTNLSGTIQTSRCNFGSVCKTLPKYN